MYSLEERCLRVGSWTQGYDDREALEGAASQLREYLEEVAVDEEEAQFEVHASVCKKSATLCCGL